MSEIVKILTHTVDLRQTLEKTDLHTLFVMGDNQAHRFELEILSGSKSADLTGSTVTAYFTNFKEDTTIKVDGKVEGGKAVVVLSKPCYTLHGQFVLTIQVKSGEAENTVFLGEGYMRRTKGETIIYDDYIVYDVSALLAQISAMKTATENANTAAGAANTAAGAANTAANNANAAAEAASQLSEQMAALQSGVEIVPTVSGSAIALNDASNLPLRGMTIYGKTTQNGTPTPDNPVKLMTAGSGGVVYAMLPVGNNLFNIDCPTLSKTIINPSGEFIAEANYNCYRIPMVADALSIGFTPNNTGDDPFRYAIEKDGIVTRYTINGTGGTARVESNRADAIWLSPSAYQTEIMVNIGKTALTYEPYNGQILDLATPNGLPGIPVASGGNYTDANGQQWICDEVDLERGVKIQRVKEHLYNGSENWAAQEVGSSRVFSIQTEENTIIRQGMSNYGYVTYETLDMVGYGCTLAYTARVRGQEWNPDKHSVDEFKAYLASNNLQILIPFAEPIVTNLTDSELAAYRALVTNKPNTTIYNDAGCDQTVRYVADTQLYIDNKTSAAMAAQTAALEGAYAEGVASA